MIRYAVVFRAVGVGDLRYDSIGKGSSTDPQDAHLYTRRDLAEKKAQYYRKHTKWWTDVQVVEVQVTWLSNG